MIIKSAEFIKSSSKITECPPPDLPEYAFTGRSNVGKSSLINYLSGRKNLAKTSSTPGKTLLINHFLINSQWYLVDLPGYGYARVPRSIKSQLGKILDSYIDNRKSLICLFLLVDARHPPLLMDVSFINLLGNKQVPFMLLFTKSDKLSDRQLKKNIDAYMDHLRNDWENLPGYFCTSAHGNRGREEILDFIEKTNLSLGNV